MAAALLTILAVLAAALFGLLSAPVGASNAVHAPPSGGARHRDRARAPVRGPGDRVVRAVWDVQPLVSVDNGAGATPPVPPAPVVVAPPTVPRPRPAPAPRARVRAESASPAVTYQAAADAPAEPSDADFDRLAQCESSSRWDLDAHNGYYGGLQFSMSTWRSLGGIGMPQERPREEQIDVGRREWRRNGWRAWPTCARRFGWR